MSLGIVILEAGIVEHDALINIAIDISPEYEDFLYVGQNVKYALLPLPAITYLIHIPLTQSTSPTLGFQVLVVAAVFNTTREIAMLKTNKYLNIVFIDKSSFYLTKSDSKCLCDF